MTISWHWTKRYTSWFFFWTAGPFSYVYSLQVRLMWGSKWGMARVLFCLSRYLPFIASIIYQYCASTYLFEVDSSSADVWFCRCICTLPEPIRLCPFVPDFNYARGWHGGRINASHCMTLWHVSGMYHDAAKKLTPVFNQGLNVIAICASEGNAAYHDLNIWSSHSLQRPSHPKNICDVELQQNCFVWSSRICGCSCSTLSPGIFIDASYI